MAFLGAHLLPHIKHFAFRVKNQAFYAAQKNTVSTAIIGCMFDNKCGHFQRYGADHTYPYPYLDATEA